ERQPLQRAVPDHVVVRLQPVGTGGVSGHLLAALVLSRTTTTTTTANRDRSAWVSQIRAAIEVGCHLRTPSTETPSRARATPRRGLHWNRHAPRRGAAYRRGRRTHTPSRFAALTRTSAPGWTSLLPGR